MKPTVPIATHTLTWAVEPQVLRTWWERWCARVGGDVGVHFLRGAAPILLDAGPSEAGWHRIDTYLRCPRLYALIYERALVQIDPGVARAAMERTEIPALITGSLTHVMVAHYSARWAAADQGFLYRWQDGWTQWDDGVEVHTVPSYQERLIRDSREILTPEVAVQVVAGRMIAEGHSGGVVASSLTRALTSFTKWQEAQTRLMAGMEIVAVERPTVHEVVLASGRKRRISSRIDRILREKHTRVTYNEDHKTSATPTLASTIDQYTISGQIALLRTFGATEFGDKFGGVKLNIIGTDAASTMLHRVDPGPAPRLAEEVLQVVPYVEDAILRDRAAGFFPPRMSNAACRYGGRRCDAWEICTLGAGVKEFR